MEDRGKDTKVCTMRKCSNENKKGLYPQVFRELFIQYLKSFKVIFTFYLSPECRCTGDLTYVRGVKRKNMGRGQKFFLCLSVLYKFCFVEQ